MLQLPEIDFYIMTDYDGGSCFGLKKKTKLKVALVSTF